MLLELAGKERKLIKARADAFRGHQPPSCTAMFKFKLFVATLFIAIVHGAAIGQSSVLFSHGNTG
jgi:hypothetical protein